MSDFAALSQALVAFVSTYFVHSTILLAACWCVLAVVRTKSHFLTERIWKLATVLGMVTAILQLIVSPDTFPLAMLSSAVGTSTVEATSQPQALDSFNIEASESADPLGEILAVPVRTDDDVQNASNYEADPNDLHLEHGDELPASLFEMTTASQVPDQHFESSTVEATLSFDEAVLHSSEFTRVPQPEEVRPLAQLTRATQTWWPVILQVFTVVLISGFIGGGLLLVIQATRLRLRFGKAQVMTHGPARLTLDRFLRRHKIRRHVRLLASQKHCEPMAYGLFRWTIMLPAGAEHRLDRNELKALLAHEVAHLVRGDVRWLWVGRVMCTCCAIQPLNFLARRRWQQAAEYLCDDWAIERGVRALLLARCLTRVAEWRFGIDPPEIGLAAGGSKATLVGRVHRLVNEQPTRDVWQRPWRRRSVTLGAASAVVVLAGFTPRVAFPLTFVGERIAGSNLNSIEELPRTPTRHEWHALEEELLQLEADLDHVEQLRDAANEPIEIADVFQDLNRRAASLQARRKHIASLLERESQR